MGVCLFWWRHACIAALLAVDGSQAFVPKLLHSTRETSVLQESGRVEWDPESASTSGQNGETFATSSAGEATLRLGMNPGPTIWTEFSRIGQENNPVNLGQGFPDWLPPEFAVESLTEAVNDVMNSPHQYTRPAGHPKLVQQLAKRYSTHMSREIEPMTEVAVTVGASQALYLSLQTLIKPGRPDEIEQWNVEYQHRIL